MTAALSGRWGRVCEDQVGLAVDQFFRGRPHSVNVAGGETDVHLHIAANPTQIRKSLRERKECSRFPIFAREHADPPHAIALLRACRDRPRRPAAEERDEIAPSKSR
jgi:hypothetical protein